MVGFVFEKITTLMSPPVKEIIDYLLKQTKQTEAKFSYFYVLKKIIKSGHAMQ